jgi:hypothetical protein
VPVAGLLLIGSHIGDGEGERMPAREGTTQHLAEIVDKPVATIAEVAERLGEVHDYALSTTTAGEGDGIVCFSGLYRTITQTIDVTPYEDRDFLVRLDLEFARRYFDALGAYAVDRSTAPRPWRMLFDARSNPEIERVQFAAAGVNAHINYDLAAALLATWVDFPPDGARRRDYDTVDAAFAKHMDELRNFYDAPFGSETFNKTALDRLANAISDLLVKGTRANAWDCAMRVWTSQDQDRARRLMLAELGLGTSLLQRAVLLPLF